MQPSHAMLQPLEIKHKTLIMPLTEDSLNNSRDKIRGKFDCLFQVPFLRFYLKAVIAKKHDSLVRINFNNM